MELNVTCTHDGIVSYPMHNHSNYEIMIYLSGEGYLHTTDIDYQFTPGTIIIVPPGIKHGSISVDGFKNISISGKFQNLFHLKNVVTLYDNEKNEGKMLATLIYDNRYRDNDYLMKLCSAYLHFISINLKPEDAITVSVNKIISEISNGFFYYDFNLAEVLKKTGYAEDYIRAKFKRITGKSPIAFLTEVRIKHAVFLIDIYYETLTLQQVAQQCGYTDYVYFSKRFRTVMGISPREYKENKRRKQYV